ncbi:TIGR03885 family FMN-dependent LLM class oxidoreductase [Cellulomonas shaoxiangyii]|uniref:TIGR03885 family FMN-dependent LLM class oxidoreductase n=1 Tax=Cellulomonas shaoxiangyii TaxID=2566013 RepID=A0A4P7SI18_9CELL|nr:TIGR03885 family FMN-dependent LLM class oxidoreductase [Cellulomonas shaoxiangyii]QCB92284.1 TIGR03885 family FMN-dependent LLM class oxidoreductase [Cellulomonas shaoxiangyii]TGY85904.1 TIGR03885 family FMN-dependent LLM class oxidoreductase [Cellulomonas shaoxiangyii]
MVRVGLHNSHEQIHPSALLAATQLAEQRGFDAAMCSDHWAPWSATQGHSGFAWTWLGAAMATTRLPFGVVNAPGQRYHPAIIAQAAATLSAMFPGRFWVALGSGENMNEHITGDGWPAKHVRDARLVECVAIIRALLDGEEVTHDGLVKVDRAQLWTLPDVKPLLIGPAVSAETAARHARWADGLVTVNQAPETLRALVDAYRDAGGRGEISLQVHVSYNPDADEAFRLAREQWAGNAVGPPVAWDLDTPEAFDAIAPKVSEDTIRQSVIVETDPARLADRVAALAEIGFDAVYLHQVATDAVPSDEKHPDAAPTVTPPASSLEAFVDVAAEHLLPVLKQVRA